VITSNSRAGMGVSASLTALRRFRLAAIELLDRGHTRERATGRRVRAAVGRQEMQRIRPQGAEQSGS
jgi:hypothetical protein